MPKRYFYILLTALAPMFWPVNSAYPQASELSKAISELTSSETETVVAALERMARLCDESCVPWLADMMRHPESAVIQAACRAAQASGNPRLAPPLIDLVRHHPMDDVRLEALKALTRMERPEDYRMLLASIDPEKPDEIQRRILRSLPKDMRKTSADKFAEFAQYSAFVTSIADAYQSEPEILFAAVCQRLTQTADVKVRQNLFRTLAILASDLPGTYRLNRVQEALFWDHPEPYLPWIAAIQASLASSDAVKWLLTWAKTMPKAVLLEVLEKIHGDAARQFTDAVIQATDEDKCLSWHRDIAPNSALARAFLETLAQYPGNHAKPLALELRYAKDPDMAMAAWQILGQFAQEPEIQQQLLDQLGHSNDQISTAAMHIAAKTPVLAARLVPIVLTSSSFDGAGKVYLARWALVMAAQQDQLQLSDDVRDALVQDAIQTVGDSRRLHAEPALYLLHELGIPLELPSPEVFSNLRPDMKRAWLSVSETQEAKSLLSRALADSDVAVASHAWRILSRHPGWADAIDSKTLDVLLKSAMHHEDAMLSLQAIVASAYLERTDLIESLQTLLTHKDTRVAYNALWALQKLRALPHTPWLKSLYYRASDGLLRERLGFLTGLDKDHGAFAEVSELYTRTPLPTQQWVHLQKSHQTHAHGEISWIQADQSLAVERANVFGLVDMRMAF